jgi:anthranilate/para-aminobenzoate synthase component II
VTAKLLVIDNYDSFTYNLVQYLGDLGAQLDVVRNDKISLAEIRAKRPDGIVLSPGPGNPDQAGVTLAVLAELGGEFHILGVCLGHQAIGQAFGGQVVRADRIMHGKTSPVLHANQSLIVRRETLPECLEVTAWTSEGEIMGLAHKQLPIVGVQFHPESILTPEGKQILANFLNSLAVGAAC